jgi:hypothetical protein
MFTTCGIDHKRGAGLASVPSRLNVQNRCTRLGELEK